MQANQLKGWIRSGAHPECLLWTYSESACYQVEIKIHNKTELLTDKHTNPVHFNSLIEAKTQLMKLGVKEVTLKLDLTCDEMMGEPLTSSECIQEMKIPL